MRMFYYISDTTLQRGGAAFKHRVFGTPPSGANGGRKSGDTPETPPGAAPLDPAFKIPMLVKGGAGDAVLLPGSGVSPISADLRRCRGQSPLPGSGVSPVSPLLSRSLRRRGKIRHITKER